MTAGGQRLRSILSQQWKHNRAAFVTWVVLRLLVVLILIRSAMIGLWENVFICLLVLFLFLCLLEDVNREFGCTMVIVTHNDAIRHMSHHILRLRDGQLVEDELNPHVMPAAQIEW